MEIIKNEDQLRVAFASVSIEDVTTTPNKVSSDDEMMTCDNSDNVNINNNQSKVVNYPIKKKERKILKHGRKRPLFKSQPITKTVCRDLNNKFVRSKLQHYIFDGCDQVSVKKYNKKIQHLKFTINFCGHRLTKLNICSYNLSDIMPLIKTNCPNIEKLVITFKVIKSEDFDNVFSNMSRLEYLEIIWDCENVTLPDTLVESLKQVDRTLKVFFLTHYEKQICILPDSLALVFPKLFRLKTLFIKGFDVNQSLIDSIGQIENLVDLTLTDPSMNDSYINKKYDMYPIGNLKKIVSIDIEWINGVTDEFLINLSNNAKKLKSLAITGTYITDKGVIALNNLNQLQRLTFEPPLSCDRKDIEYITDESIQRLKLEKLMLLYLSNCINITKSSMNNLVENLPSLKSLHLKRTKVTEDDVKEIRQTLKKYMNITYDGMTHYQHV